MYLFLDDERSGIEAVYWIAYPEHLKTVPWVVLRNGKDFIDFILRNGIPKVVSLDHDLDWSAIMEWEIAQIHKKPIDYTKITELTGFDCARWLVRYCRKTKVPLPEIYVHSHNPEGSKNIREYLKQEGISDSTVPVESVWV